MPLYEKYPSEDDIYRVLRMNPDHIFNDFMKVYNCDLPIKKCDERLLFDFDLLDNLICLRKIFPETPYLKHWQKDWLDEFIRAGYSCLDSINRILNLTDQLKWWVNIRGNAEKGARSCIGYDQNLYSMLMNNRILCPWFLKLQKKYKELHQKKVEDGSEFL